MKTKLVYSPRYNFGLMGLEKLHPFDAKKFSRTWHSLESEWRGQLSDYAVDVPEPISDEQLLRVHSSAYLNSLHSNKNITKVVEISAIHFLPNLMLQKGLITPARFATAGTLEAARLALTGCMAMNIGGGFHHAFADHGEGFCFFADAALAIETLRAEDKLSPTSNIVMIDLDAHRGNGFTSFYEDDKHVGIFDLYNMQVYPGLKEGDPEDFPWIIPMRAGLGSSEYLQLVEAELPRFLDHWQQPALAFYNAGTDVLSTDKLGALNVSYDAVKTRDRFVVDLLRKKSIPTVTMTSGGYSKESYQLIAALASYLINTSD